MAKTFWDELYKPTQQTVSKGMGEGERSAALQAMQKDYEKSTYDPGNINLEDVGAGAYSALNSALFGIPDVVVKAADTEAYKKLQALRERNQAASTIGNIGGMFVPTPALAAKGVSAGAKAVQSGLKAGKAAETAGKIARGADTAADFMQAKGAYEGVKGLKGIGQGALRGTIESGLQTAPRLASGETDGKTAGAALLAGAGIGGALSAAAPLVSKGLERVPEELTKISKWGNKTILKNADINNRILRQAEKYAGNDPAQYVKELADFAVKNQLHREPKLDALVAQVKNTWQTIGNNFDNAGIKMSDDLPQLYKMDNIKEVLARNPAAVTDVADMVGKVDATSNFAAKRKYLNDIIYDLNTPKETKNIAKDIALSIEEKAEQLSGLDIGKAKHDWKMMKPFETADIRDELSTTGAGLARGSDTVAKMALGGIGLGGTQVSGVIDDPSNPEAWKRLIGATLGGTATGGLSKALSFQLAKVAQKLDPDDLRKLVSNPSLLNKVVNLAGKADLENVIPKLVSASMTEETPEQTRDKMGEIQEPESVQAMKEKYMTENGMEPSTAEAAVEKTKEYGQGYMDKLTEKMAQYWAENFSDQMSFEDYQAAVASQTDNFSPEKSVTFLFDNQADGEKFLRDLEVSRKISGVDLNEIYAPGKFLESGADRAARAKKQMDLVDTVSSLITKPGTIPSKLETDTIKADIAAITKLDATSAEKRQILIDLLTGPKYNLGYNEIASMGLV